MSERITGMSRARVPKYIRSWPIASFGPPTIVTAGPSGPETTSMGDAGSSHTTESGTAPSGAKSAISKVVVSGDSTTGKMGYPVDSG